MLPLMGSDVLEPLWTVSAACLVSATAYKAIDRLLPRLGPAFVERGLKGFDQLKGLGLPGRAGKAPIPEAVGVIGAGVYLLLLACFVPIPYLRHILQQTSAFEGGSTPSLSFPHHSLTAYLASLLSLLIATSLGFLDDLFDIRWRYKLPIPIIASVPLLVVYFAADGITDVVLPDVLGLHQIFRVSHRCGILSLGPLYYMYMAMLSTFCTNSINILAGINGVEAGQSLVIGASVALNDLLYLDFDLSGLGMSTNVGFALARGSLELRDRHLFSLYFMLPMIGVCGALLKHNWYPARVFVGDTFCYFAGMTFAVVGILGHFSKTLLLFFLPQIFNFIFSSPQLFGLVPCPRHRLPQYDAQTNLLQPSYALLQAPPTRLTNLILNAFSLLGLIRLRRDKQNVIIACTNLTLINVVLVRCGAMRESRLTAAIMCVQVVCSGIAFGVRYGGASWFYQPESGRS